MGEGGRLGKKNVRERRPKRRARSLERMPLTDTDRLLTVDCPAPSVFVVCPSVAKGSGRPAPTPYRCGRRRPVLNSGRREEEETYFLDLLSVLCRGPNARNDTRRRRCAIDPARRVLPINTIRALCTCHPRRRRRSTALAFFPSKTPRRNRSRIARRFLEPSPLPQPPPPRSIDEICSRTAQTAVARQVGSKMLMFRTERPAVVWITLWSPIKRIGFRRVVEIARAFIPL